VGKKESVRFWDLPGGKNMSCVCVEKKGKIGGGGEKEKRLTFIGKFFPK